METVKFEHLKEYVTPSGIIITMKSLITINLPGVKIQLIECYEDKTAYPVELLKEI